MSNPVVIFPERLSAYNINNYLSKDIAKVYKQYEGKDDITFDLTGTKYLIANSLPILLCIGYSISKTNRIILKFNDSNDRIVKYLYYSMFFTVSDNLNIFDYTTSVQGSYKAAIDYEVSYFKPDYSYNNLKTESDKSKYRTNLNMNLRSMQRNINKMKRNMQSVLKKTDGSDRLYLYDEDNNSLIVNSEHILLEDPSKIISMEELLMLCFAELVTNATVHSDSICFVMQQNTKYASYFSISDNGIGFEESLLNLENSFQDIADKNKARIIRNKYKCKNTIEYQISIILDALNYSKIHNRKRPKLWNCLVSVVENNGVFRVRCGNVQLLFGSRCIKCPNITNVNSTIEKCYECIMQNSRNYHVFPICMKGVHIEIELPTIWEEE